MIAVVGEALVDLRSDGASAATYRACNGGGPATAAVALARLGSVVSFVGRLSNDNFGRGLRSWLCDNGVDVSMVVDVPNPTTLAVATVGDSGSANYEFYWQDTSNFTWREADFPTDLPTSVDALHFGSLVTALEPAAAQIEAWASRWSGCVTTFVDPNFRPDVDVPRSARERLDRWLASADIVKLSLDDLRFSHPGCEPLSLVRAWTRARPALLVVLTLADRGALACLGEAEVSANYSVTRLVDTIGAGDTFGAALLYGLERQGALRRERPRTLNAVRRALEFACCAASLSCASAGASPPRIAEMPAEMVANLAAGSTPPAL